VARARFASDEERKAYNRDKQRQYQARRKAREQAQSVTDTPLTVEPDDLPLKVEVKVDDTPKPQPSLKERLLAKIGAQPESTPTPKRTTGGKKKVDNLVTTTLPTVCAAFIATYSRTMMHDPYKPCAPSQEEVASIVGPLFDILGRQVELTGKASQDTIDLINAIVCSAMYGLRAYMTYTQIKQAEEAYASNKERASIPHSGTYARSSQHNGSGPTSSGNESTAENDATGSNTNHYNGDTEGEPTEASLIAEMLRRDIEGRIRLGLLSGDVRRADGKAS
jgi:hypothetical protein